MATATAGYEWNHTRSASSPLRSSPDTTSPMYPDRPIRPLPKRRLRARLSPEQAESIVYPPALPSSTPLFNFPYSPAEARAAPRVERRRGESDHHACHCGHNHSEVESDEDEDERGPRLASSPSYHYSRGKTAGYPKPASTSSSADGYESFENTNNKKKRKIPNMGGTSAHHASLSAEMASMGLSHDGADDADGPGRYYVSAPPTPQHSSSGSTSGTGLSGPGRGRFGRPSGGRTERRVLASSAGNAALGKASGSTKRAPDHHNQGIISTAIANANQHPPTNENVSLLQHEATKQAQSKTQFTFTCGSDSASNMVWPAQSTPGPNASYPQPPGAYPMPSASVPPSQHPQYARSAPPPRPEAPLPPTQCNDVNGAPRAPPGQNGQPSQRGGGQDQSKAAPPPRKPKMKASKLYELAARKRREKQYYENCRNPPSKDSWVCEFCEYELIFGEPPMALIRQYEQKDRAERRRLAEKRRLLEKARMKGKRGKKASKKAQQNGGSTAQNQQALRSGYDQHPDDSSLDAPPDEYYGDEDYVDDCSPHAQPGEQPCSHPSCNRHLPHKGPPPVPNDPGDGTSAPPA
ncbi:hypothetical protein M011DRAFT_467273 [Sporormia fimetaria CBS 119925]|uniref:Uncharacterized protein n=1 Tax=Sporormia fimetaria CBS 119925 TaxID=1340428 RepID=A0A6A6VGB0_9PLEO|nr:hypothetical protein M011DRAFT_467273 [Sporormia fimetaria CBS 119925]